MPASLLRERKFIPTPVNETHTEKPLGPFSQFPKLERVKVRDPQKKDPLTILRAQRGMLKSGNLTPDQIYSMMEIRRDIDFFEALALAQRNSWLIIPNIVQDGISNQMGVQYSAWTGTVVAYPRPYSAFGDRLFSVWTANRVNYIISVEIPADLRGRSGCAIAVEHPDFELVTLEINPYEQKYELRMAKGAEIHLVEDFPKRDGWYKTNELGIPFGHEVRESAESRNLRRCISYIGPVRHTYDDFYFSALRGVNIDFAWSIESDVAFLK